MIDYARGPDFSKWNPDNDWSILGPSGICNIAGMRASYGKGIDPTFASNYNGSRPYVVRIIYHWFAARVNVDEQIHAFLRAVNDASDGQDWAAIPAIDFEALQQVPTLEAAKGARKWIDAVRPYFDDRMLFYTNYNLGKQVRGLFDDCDLWLAWPFSAYNDRDPDPALFYPLGPWVIRPILWQCTWNRGGIPGVPDQTVDWNISNLSIGAFKMVFGLGETPLPPPPPNGDEEMLKMKVTATALNVREGPSTSHKDIGDLHYGDVVEVLDVGSDGYGAWVKFNYYGTPAWACVQWFGNRYMEVVK